MLHVVATLTNPDTLAYDINQSNIQYGRTVETLIKTTLGQGHSSLKLILK